MMATECYVGTIPLLPHSSTLPLPLPTARCIPEDGICFTSLSQGGGQATAQLGCWPSQTTMKLAWLGVPECKNEVGRLVCLCLESLCNGKIPSASELIPEGGDLQGLMMLLLVLILIVMLVVVFYSLNKQIKKHAMKDHSDLEHGDNSIYMERNIQPYQIAPSPYYNFPPTPPNSCGSPAPLLRSCSAPANIPSPRQSGDHQVKAYIKKVTKNARGPSEVTKSRPMRGMEGPLVKYLDMTNCKTFLKPVTGIKRLDRGEGDGAILNMAFTKEDPKVTQVKKGPGKVTAV